MKQKKEYDPGIMGKAISGIALRVVVAAYLVYLAWKVLTGALNGGSPIPEWGAWLIFLAFAAAAAGFCVFSWKQYKKALNSAVISENSQLKNDESDSLSEAQSKKDKDDR